MITEVPDGESDIQQEQFFQDSLKEEPGHIPTLEERMSLVEIKLGELIVSTNSVGAMVENASTAFTQAMESFNNGGMSRLFKGVFSNGG